MPASHVPFDHVIFLSLALVWPLLDYFWLYPRLIRQTEARVPGARIRAYVTGILTQWSLAAAVLLLWTARHRPWTDLWIGASGAIRLAAGLALSAALVGLLLIQRRAILARPELLGKVRKQLSAAGPLLPHTSTERRCFMLLSITAGICEELLFRGFAFWYLRVWTGLLFAALISVIVFGAAHLYLSRRDALRAGLVGAVMTVIVIATRSLLPAVIMHAAIDMNSGDLAFHALREPSA